MKIIKLISVIIITAILIAIGKYIFDLSFSGNNKVILIKNGEKIENLEQLIQLNEFHDYVLYIDVWGTSCHPCINEFKHAPVLKEKYKDKDVKFIYLSVLYNHFNDKQQWKMLIRKFNLCGYHMQISNSFYEKLWEYEGIADAYSIPHFILVDRKGQIRYINAARPSEYEKLCRQLDGLLNE